MVLESTVPRATRRPSLQAWILFGVMGPFLYVCGLWDYLRSVRAALQARRFGAWSGESSPDFEPW